MPNYIYYIPSHALHESIVENLMGNATFGCNYTTVNGNYHVYFMLSLQNLRFPKLYRHIYPAVYCDQRSCYMYTLNIIFYDVIRYYKWVLFDKFTVRNKSGAPVS